MIPRDASTNHTPAAAPANQKTYSSRRKNGCRRPPRPLACRENECRGFPIVFTANEPRGSASFRPVRRLLVFVRARLQPCRKIRHINKALAAEAFIYHLPPRLFSGAAGAHLKRAPAPFLGVTVLQLSRSALRPGGVYDRSASR